MSGEGVSISEILEVMSESGDGVLADGLSLIWLFSRLVFPAVDCPNDGGDDVNERKWDKEISVIIIRDNRRRLLILIMLVFFNTNKNK